jgi:hypothetical protein
MNHNRKIKAYNDFELLMFYLLNYENKSQV